MRKEALAKWMVATLFEQRDCRFADETLLGTVQSVKKERLITKLARE